MATSTKQTTTLNVYVNDEAGGTTVFKLNNPKSTVTLADVNTAFGYFFSSIGTGFVNILQNNQGWQLVSVERAETVTTLITTTPLTS